MNEIKYVYVMDYSIGSISRIDISNVEDDDIERILESKGFNIDECAYMYSNEKIDYVDVID